MSASDVLTRALDAVLVGRLTVDEFSAIHPELAADLREMVVAARWLDPMPELGPTRSELAAGRARLVESIHARQARAPWWTRGWSVVLRGGALAGFALLVVGSLGVGSVFAAQDALPGDALYGVKSGVEALEEARVPSNTRVPFLIGLAKRRVGELERATDADRPVAARLAAASFVNTLERADRILTDAAAAGVNTVPVLAAAEASLDEQRQALARAAERASPAVAPAITSAAAAATDSLQRARATALAYDPQAASEARVACGQLATASERRVCNNVVTDAGLTATRARQEALLAAEWDRVTLLTERCDKGPADKACVTALTNQRQRVVGLEALRVGREMANLLSRFAAAEASWDRDLQGRLTNCASGDPASLTRCEVQARDATARLRAVRLVEFDERERDFLSTAAARCTALGSLARGACEDRVTRDLQRFERFLATRYGERMPPTP